MGLRCESCVGGGIQFREEDAMRILLSDGAGLTARQCATLLSDAGHEVEALSAEPLCLCRFTRHVR